MFAGSACAAPCRREHVLMRKEGEDEPAAMVRGPRWAGLLQVVYPLLATHRTPRLQLGSVSLRLRQALQGRRACLLAWDQACTAKSLPPGLTRLRAVSPAPRPFLTSGPPRGTSRSRAGRGPPSAVPAAGKADVGSGRLACRVPRGRSRRGGLGGCGSCVGR